MREQEIKELNKALKGEHMAIETCDHFIHDIDDETLKEYFQTIQKTHKKQATELAERIQDLGGNPVNTAGLAGAITEMKNRISPKKYLDDSIMKTIIEGEEIGINALKEIKNNLTKYESITLVDHILAENQKIFDDLKQLP